MTKTRRQLLAELVVQNALCETYRTRMLLLIAEVEELQRFNVILERQLRKNRLGIGGKRG